MMETPVALHVSKRVLTVPMYADLAFEDVDKICASPLTGSVPSGH